MATKLDKKPEIKPAAAPPKPTTTPKLKTPVDVMFLLMPDGNFQVHLKGCKQYPTQKKRSQYAGVKDDYGYEEIVNQIEVVRELWDDQIRETWAEENDGNTDEYAEASWAWLSRQGYVGAVKFHTCLDGLPQSSKAAAKTSEATAKQAKTDLATMVALAAAEVVRNLRARAEAEDGDADAKRIVAAFASGKVPFDQCVAQWLHGMPVDRDAWYNAGLPIPARSDWADYVPPSTVQENQPE